MKKTIFTAILAIVAVNINAQLVVDSLGQVGIGTDSVKSNLAVRTAGTTDVVAYFKATGFSTGAYTVNGDGALARAKHHLSQHIGVTSPNILIRTGE